MQTLNYDQFLFSQLLQLHNENYTDLEYGILFNIVPTLYRLWHEGDDDSIGMYESMESFIQNNERLINSRVPAAQADYIIEIPKCQRDIVISALEGMEVSLDKLAASANVTDQGHFSHVRFDIRGLIGLLSGSKATVTLTADEYNDFNNTHGVDIPEYINN